MTLTCPTGTGFTCVASATASETPTIANRSAVLSRPDGGSLSVKGWNYSGDTLLSWPEVAGGTAPGVTAQTLEGKYAGTWSQLNGHDNVSVSWSGAKPYGGYGVLPPTSTMDTIYPLAMPSTDAPGGVMPLASGISKQTQTWTYEVQDQGDGSTLPLTCKWTCHFAFEDLSGDVARNVVCDKRDFTVELTSTASSGKVTVPATTQLACSTTWTVTTPNSKIPGFAITGQHIADSTLQDRWGKTSTYINDLSGKSGTFNVEMSDIWGPGLYGKELQLLVPHFIGTATAWNALGQSLSQYITYELDNNAKFELVDITPPIGTQPSGESL